MGVYILDCSIDLDEELVEHNCSFHCISLKEDYDSCWCSYGDTCPGVLQLFVFFRCLDVDLCTHLKIIYVKLGKVSPAVLCICLVTNRSVVGERDHLGNMDLLASWKSKSNSVTSCILSSIEPTFCVKKTWKCKKWLQSCNLRWGLDEKYIKITLTTTCIKVNIKFVPLWCMHYHNASLDALTCSAGIHFETYPKIHPYSLSVLESFVHNPLLYHQQGNVLGSRRIHLSCQSPD